MHQKLNVRDLMDLDIRPFQLGDAPHILNIDLKCSEFPFDIEDWQMIKSYFPHWEILMAVIRKQPCAFIMYDYDSENRVGNLHKFAALPYALKAGVIGYLIDVISNTALLRGFTHLELIVPSNSCRGGNDTYDRSSLLLRNNFKCTKIITEAFEAYGEADDGFVFRKTIM